MSSRAKCLLWALVAIGGWAVGAAAADVGSGAPTTEIRLSFQEAYFRGRFQFRAAAPPANDVRRFGTSGYVQEFADPTRPTFNSALVNSGAAEGSGGSTWQMLSRLWRFWAPPGNNQTSGLNTYGFPVSDAAEFSAAAPGRETVSGEWQEFQNGAAIFSWAANPEGLSETDFPVSATFYIRWAALGRDSGLGFATSVQGSFTSPRGGQSQVQRFTRGGLYQWSAGSLNGQLFSVREPFYTAYRNVQGEAGFLGLPLGEERALAGNRREQSFEGGTLDLTNGVVTVRPRVVRVRLIGPNPLRLNAGETGAIRAEMETLAEQIVTDRVVTFTIGLQTVATVTATGTNTAIVRGVGNGSTTVTAVSEGVTSNTLTVTVTAPCCRVGEGAPAAVSEAMLAALTRNRLEVRVPLAAPARRSGAGWTQDAVSPDGTTGYLLTRSDASATAYILTGEFRSLWEIAGGAAGSLGFPISDRSPAGRQDFENGTLAGRPARLVSGSIRSRWLAAGAESGTLGLPTTSAAPYLSFAGSSGLIQTFTGGVIVTQATQAFAVTGVIRDYFLALGGISGNLGAPLTEFASGRQVFEGGVISLSGSTVTVTETPRRPRVAVSPAVVAPGNRTLATLGGFINNARVRVTFPGTSVPSFFAPIPAGAFTWEIPVPLDARPGPVTIRAEDIDRPGFVTQATYSVAVPVGVEILKAGGDGQVGVPGGFLPEPLRIRVVDRAGVPLAGQRVRWEASPGAAIDAAQLETDVTGQASARLRLPFNESVALVSVTAGGDVETFNARASGQQLVNFPRLLRTASTSALLAATASALRFRQQQSQIPAAGGLADVEILDAFLTAYCVPDTGTGQICDGYLGTPTRRFVNFWRLHGFTGGGIQVRTGIGPIRDWVAAGSPVIAILLFRGAPHAVVATGVAPNGAVLVHDPDPALALPHLEAYTEAGAQLLDMVRLEPGPEETNGFLVFGSGSLTVSSPGPACNTLRYADRDRAAFCNGTVPTYQVDRDGSPISVTSYTTPGLVTNVAAGPLSSLRIYQPGPAWVAEPLTVTFDAGSVVNSANFRPGIAPGSAATVFGAGLAGAEVELGGQAARRLFASAFQVNFEVPPGTAPGNQILRVRGPFGEASQSILVEPNAPAIFLLADGRGAVTNQNSALNTRLTPARRGDVVILYATGLGQTVSRPDGLSEAREPVRVVANGVDYVPLFAGLTPGFPGLYQVNWRIPESLAPGVLPDVRLWQGGAQSAPVEVAVQ